jgi:uncharacterized protein (AIM24 family)
VSTTLTQCAWCHAQFPVELTSCPRCGAAADVRAVVDQGGWIEAPGIKDMAEVQFGQSHAQVEGLMVPVVDVDLAAGDTVLCTHDKLLWHDGTVKLSTKKAGFFKSHRSGMPLTLMQATGPGRIAFSDNHPGELTAMPLDTGQVLVARQHHMLLATGNVDYDGHNINLWYTMGSGDDQETEYPVGNFERFGVPGGDPGLVFIHAAGNVFIRNLQQGEAVDVAPHSLLAWRGPMQTSLMIERKPLSGYYNHYLSVRVEGPGTVWIQSGAMGKTQEHNSISGTCANTYIRDV